MLCSQAGIRMKMNEGGKLGDFQEKDRKDRESLLNKDDATLRWQRKESGRLWGGEDWGCSYTGCAAGCHGDGGDTRVLGV